uniref:(northern house mosquito) hypothetical protein n=1 Tax=Culex pipiens TaxID=7175 RepID=A0A8D8IRK1_CULPI
MPSKTTSNRLLVRRKKRSRVTSSAVSLTGVFRWRTCSRMAPCTPSRHAHPKVPDWCRSCLRDHPTRARRRWPPSSPRCPTFRSSRCARRTRWSVSLRMPSVCRFGSTLTMRTVRRSAVFWWTTSSGCWITVRLGRGTLT